MKILVRIAFSLSLALSACCLSQAATESQPPNIIFILADDLGYSGLGCYGQKIIRTPELDKMAAEGIRFTQFYAGSAVCGPSRSTFLTGQHTGHTPIRGNGAGMRHPEGNDYPMPEDANSVAKVLKKAGYTTGIIGKWGLGLAETSGAPSKQGFDFSYGYLGHVHGHHYYVDYLYRNEVKEDTRGLYTHDLFTNEALAFIDRNKSNPFFLYLAYTIPHAYYEQKDTSDYDDSGLEGEKKVYASMISRMDRDIGWLLRRLREQGIDKNTLVIFTSDNGGDWNDKEPISTTEPLRGKKRDLYEGGIREPFVAWWPGKIPPGSESDHLSALWDMLPTFAELAGQAPPPDIDGISMVPTLLGKSGQKEHDYLYWEFYEKTGARAVRKGPWKAIRLNTVKNPESPIELYNLEQDISEKNNIAAKHPDIVRQMEEIMKQAHSPSLWWEIRKKQLKEKPTTKAAGNRKAKI